MSMIVLSGKRQDTARFTKQIGARYIKHVVNCDSIPAFADEIHILPSYFERRDIHAIEAKLKHVERRPPRPSRTFWDETAEGFVPQIDVGPDAVPGQTGISEHIAESLPLPLSDDNTSGNVEGDIDISELTLPELLAAESAAAEEYDRKVEAEQNFRSDPPDDFFDFLDES